jgi:hypothetical protein
VATCRVTGYDLGLGAGIFLFVTTSSPSTGVEPPSLLSSLYQVLFISHIGHSMFLITCLHVVTRLRMHGVLYLEGVLLRQSQNYSAFKFNIFFFFEYLVVILLIKRVPVIEPVGPSW